MMSPPGGNLGGAAPSGCGTLTVLFTDLVGSTELMTRMGDEAFDELRAEHFARLRDAVVVHGGQNVKNTGDGILATFPSTAEALACAVTAQQVAHRQATATGWPISLRVGLSAGEVLLDSGDVFGRPVVEAARLVAAARPGQILLSSVVGVLAGTRIPGQLTAVGTVELKGLAEPIGVCELAWAPEAVVAPPLPGLLAAAGRVFVAREREQAQIERLWNESVGGERRLALLCGEPGIGKTHLASRVAETVRDRGGFVLAGRCDEDLGVPYQPFVECLRTYLQHVPSARLGRYPGELVRLVPEVADATPELPPPLRSDAETERYRLFDAVASWLVDLGSQQPVLLVLDDLHWAAKPTLMLLRHILHFSSALPLLVIATYRDTDVGPSHPLADLLADLRREAGVSRFVIGGLTAGEVASLMEGARGHAVSDDDGQAFAHLLHEETAGNPFFVKEVLRHLTETGGITEQDGRWSATVAIEELGIPEGVRDVVERRIRRLPPAAWAALSEAAVVGLEFDLAVLLAMGGGDEDDLLALLDQAAAARLVAEVAGPVPRYRFAHALVRDTIYGGISAGRRVRAHRRAAEAIEAVYAPFLDDHLPALAHHYSRAAAPSADTDKAVEYAVRAAERASRQLAHDEAVAFHHRAFDLLDARAAPDDAARLKLLIGLGEAQLRAGEPDHRQTLLDAARLAKERGDTAALVRAALANTRVVIYNTVTVDAERVAVLESALAAVGESPGPDRARLLAQLGLELAWCPERERRVRCADQALELARESGDPELLVAVLSSRFYTIWAPTRAAGLLADSALLVDLAEQFDDPVLTLRASWLRYRTALEAGDANEARRHAVVVADLATDLGQPLLRWLAGWVAAGVAHLDGREEDSARLLRATLALGRRLDSINAEHTFVSQCACLDATGDDQPDDGGLLDGLAAADLPHPIMVCWLALRHSRAGRLPEARKVVAPIVAAGFATIPHDIAYLAELAALARVATDLGDAEAAGELMLLLRPHCDLVASAAAMPWGSVHHFLGLLATTIGDLDAADETFAAAAATHSRLRAPAFLAHTQFEWAGALRQRHRPADAGRANQLLAEAATTADALGLRRLAHQIHILNSN